MTTRHPHSASHDCWKEIRRNVYATPTYEHVGNVLFSVLLQYADMPLKTTFSHYSFAVDRSADFRAAPGRGWVENHIGMEGNAAGSPWKLEQMWQDHSRGI